jgi:5-methyltetrahydrofolate--homocysteine methyltransferase
MNIDDLRQHLIEGDAPGTVALTKEALEEGIPAQEILNGVLIPGMGVVGDLSQKNEYFVPDLLLAARAMYGALDRLRPKLTEGDYQPAGNAIVGTVQGDLHDIGKKLVTIMLEGSGFHVTDLGTDVAPEKFLEAVRESSCNLVGLSALLTTTLPAVEKTVKALKDVDPSIRVIVVGAPVTQAFADSIGADGYGRDVQRRRYPGASTAWKYLKKAACQ